MFICCSDSDTTFEQINQHLIICTMYCIPIYATFIVSSCYFIVRCMLLKKYITIYARKEFKSLLTSGSIVVPLIKFKLFLSAARAPVTGWAAKKNVHYYNKIEVAYINNRSIMWTVQLRDQLSSARIRRPSVAMTWLLQFFAMT